MLGAAGLFALGFLAVTAFVFDDAGHVTSHAAAFDRSIAQALQQVRAPALTGRVIEVSALGSAPVLVVLALLAYSVIIGARDRPGFLHLTIAIVGAGAWSRLLQHLFERERPDTLLPFLVVTEGSYPSAHLFGAAACYATFAFFYARYTPRRGAAVACCVVAAVLILCIGATRIYLGAHHTTDVIGGICGGAAWALLLAAIFSHRYANRPLEP
ncbi:MAG: phosphatase family protein [Panacagrimonas sp.]|nr:phosphatase family protein [Panacagrimonas sp.]